jgi:predicted permease
MSELAMIALVLGLFLLALAVGAFLCRVMYKRCDDILSGVVNGVPISLTSRWLFFIQDYVGVSSGVTMVGGVMAFGFVAMADAASDSNAQALAYVCAFIGAGYFFFNLLLGAIWMRHFTSVLREAKPT